VLLRAPHRNRKQSASPVAEIGGQQFPLIAIHDQSLTLGNYHHPSRAGDFLRLHLSFSPSMPAQLSLLAVVTAVNQAAAEVVCSIESADPQCLALLRQFVPDPAGAAPPPPPSRLRSAAPGGAGLVALVLTGGVGLWMLRSLAASMATVTIENGVIAPPPGPVVAAVEPVVARERGLIDQVFGREGMAVVPGQPLFSVRQDPRVDLDLLDRQAARDLNGLEARLRDSQGELDALTQQIALNRQEVDQLPASATAAQLLTLAQQIAVARRLEQRRLVLLRQGGISQDSYDSSLDRLLDLEARRQLLLRQTRADQGRRDRIGVLQALAQEQRLRMSRLSGERQRLQSGVDQRRALRRQHPLSGSVLATPLEERAVYKASAPGLLLRQLKTPGTSIQPNEAVFLLQKQQLPPLIQAQVVESEWAGLLLGSEGIAEIPALRQQHRVRLVGMAPRGAGSHDLRFELVQLEANDQRQLVALLGKSARLFLPNRRNWLERLRGWWSRPSL